VTPHHRSETLKPLEWALALNLSHQGHSTGCSQMGCCYHPGCGRHPPRAVGQQAPPSAMAQQTPAAAQHTVVAMAQQSPLTGVGYCGVPTARR
jgi:hypothetical protein